jgi:predicted DNA binding protein
MRTVSRYRSRESFYAIYSDEGLQKGLEQLESIYRKTGSELVASEIKSIKKEIETRRKNTEEQIRILKEATKTFPQRKWGIDAP